MFEITVVADDQHWAKEKIDSAVAEIKRIENLFTTYNDASVTNIINANAGIKEVVVCSEMLELIKRANRISEITDGAFDLSYGSLDKSLWNFDQEMKSLPTPDTAKNIVKFINYKNIIIDNERSTVFLKNNSMRIGFGGIGKGYAAEMAKNVLMKQGVLNGLVNASGDLTAWGKQANGEFWKVGIADPNNADMSFSYLQLNNQAVATSGNYEKFVMVNGKKYSHTINPKTGLPINGIKSVTVITTNAELADAMTTPIAIMGIHAGLNLVNQIKNLDCIIIDDYDKIYTTKNIHLS